MERYYFNKNTTEKKYGICESLLENQNRIDYNNDEANIFKEKYAKLKSLGAINKDKYLLYVGDIDKTDHYDLTNIIECSIGNFNFWFSFWYKHDKLQSLNIYHTTNGDEKSIQEQLLELEYLMSIISECIAYNNINFKSEWKLEISMPSYFFENKNEDHTYTNLGECLTIIQNKYNNLKKSYIDNEAKVKIKSLY